MQKYIGLLRGINVGGRNKVAMATLREVFEAQRFVNVSTYINSGNIFFSSEETDLMKVQEICESAILNHFNLDIRVGIITPEELEVALENAPTWWGKSADHKHNAFFVIRPQSPVEILDVIGETSEIEKIGAVGQVIFWSAPPSFVSKSNYFKVERKIKDMITIRNLNTTRKILELSQK